MQTLVLWKKLKEFFASRPSTEEIDKQLTQEVDWVKAYQATNKSNLDWIIERSADMRKNLREDFKLCDEKAWKIIGSIGTSISLTGAFTLLTAKPISMFLFLAIVIAAIIALAVVVLAVNAIYPYPAHQEDELRTLIEFADKVHTSNQTKEDGNKLCDQEIWITKDHLLLRRRQKFLEFKRRELRKSLKCYRVLLGWVIVSLFIALIGSFLPARHEPSGIQVNFSITTK